MFNIHTKAACKSHNSYAMAVAARRKAHTLYLYVLLFGHFRSLFATGIYFKLVTGREDANEQGEKGPLVRKEFFQCGREQSCTNILKLASGYVLVYGTDELSKRKHEAECIYQKINVPGIKLYDFLKATIIHGKDDTHLPDS